MTAYNGQYRCPGGQKPGRPYKRGPMAICSVCERGPLDRYPNGMVVVHKREAMLPPWLRVPA